VWRASLGRIDDFIVTLTQPDGATRSFPARGAIRRKFEVHDPLKTAIKDLLPVLYDIKTSTM